MTAIRPCPADIVEIYRELGSLKRLARHYKAAHHTIRRWLMQAGLEAPKSDNARPAPTDFIEVAAKTTKAGLSRHYGVGPYTIDRWILVMGAATADPNSIRLRPVQRDSTTYRTPVPPPKRDNKYDLAAEYLRKFMPVHRCNDRGVYQENGEFYRVGRTVTTKEELVRRCEKKRNKK